MRRLSMIACGLAAFSAAAWAQNLLQDPGFEELADGAPAIWRFSGGSGLVTDADVAHSGQRCAKARFDDGVSQQLSIKGGSAYRISGWIRRVDPSGTEVPKIKVYFLDAKGGRADVQAAQFEGVTAAQWHAWQTVFQSPISAATMSLTLRAFYGGSEWFYYDDLVVERVEAPSWPALATVPCLHGVTVTVPDIADVWTDALLRIPPNSLAPVDGLLGTSVFTHGDDIRVELQRPVSVNWALVHSMRPSMNLGKARLLSRDATQSVPGTPRLLATSESKTELVTSLLFKPTALGEVVLDIPDDAEAYVNEIQLFGVGEDSALPGEAVELTFTQRDLPESVAADLALGFSAEEHRTSLLAVSGQPAPASGRIVLPPEHYVNLFAVAGMVEFGLAGVRVDLALPGAGDGDLIEVSMRRPAELDVDIRWTTHSDRGLEPRGNRRNYATVFRVVSRVKDERLSATFDVPDLIYAKAEPVWLTLRARAEMALDVASTRVTLYKLATEQAYAEYLPQLERLMRRMYSDASEAHAYDGRDWSRMVIGGYVRRVLAIDPNSRAAGYIYRRIAKVRENVTLKWPGPASAPDWAVWAREVLRGRDAVIRWWLDNRQQANGELAGHINDDGEFSCNWPSHYLMAGDARIADGLRKLAEVAWEMSAGTGYTVGSRDVEHAAEDQSCTQPQVLLVDYGNPKAVERFMVMSRYLDTWTAINEAGRRQFKSYMFTAKQIWDDPPFDVDQPYCPLAMVGTGHLVWYTHSPKVADIFMQEAESWALGCLSTDGGKPAGQIPKEIAARDSRINPYAPYPGNPILQKRNSLYRNGAGAYIVRYFIQGAHALTQADVYARVLALWEPADAQKIEKAEDLCRRFNETVTAPTGAERRYTVAATDFSAIEAPMATVREGRAVGTGVTDDGGSATYTVTVEQQGRYALWGALGRSDAAEKGVEAKTFFARVDGNVEDRIRIHSPAQEWTPVATSTTYELERGEHTVTIRARTPGSALREIGFTSQYSVEGTWSASQGETTLYDAWRVSGDRKWLVEELKEAVRQQIRSHWLLTAAEPYTDRVPLPGRNVLSRMFLGDWTSGKSHVPGHWVSWEGGGLDYAALLLRATPEHLKALVHSFHATERAMTMRVWRLPHGHYDVSIGIDRDGDDQVDEPLRREQMELWRYDGAVPFTARPGQTLVIELALRESLADVRTRPDLAIGPEDIIVQDGAATVTVHNIGGSASSASTVEVRTADDTVLASAVVPGLEPPHDLRPKTAQLRIDLPAGAEPAAVVLDPDDDLAEITERNNRVALGDGGPPR